MNTQSPGQGRAQTLDCKDSFTSSTPVMQYSRIRPPRSSMAALRVGLSLGIVAVGGEGSRVSVFEV